MTTLSISELCASFAGEDGFFAKFRSLACQLEGVEDIVLVVSGERLVDGSVRVVGSVPMKYLGKAVGELHLFYDPRHFENRSPLALAKFLAGQLGIALQGAAIRHSNAIFQNELAELLAGIQERKLLEKAQGLIESRRLIPTGEGQRLMRKVCAQSGRKLRDLAQGIVSSANRNPWKSRRSFWA